MTYQFGPYKLDPHTGDLTGPDGPIVLRRQAFRLLQVLLENAPALMDRDTLLDQAWGRTAISPNVLPQGISELRQALGDNPQQPQYIETLHRRGYRMICPVIREQPGTSSRHPSQAQTPAQPSEEPSPDRSRTRGLNLAVPGLATLVVALAGALALSWYQQRDERWLRNTLPEIRQLIESDVASAWHLARQARERAGDNPQLEQLWLDLTLPANIISEPPGATVMVRGYDEQDPGWTTLGTTPLERVRLPLTMLRFRLELDGHEAVELAPSVLPSPEIIHLHPAEQTPPGMVFVRGGPVRFFMWSEVVEDFWIDRHEVSNQDYLAFVEDGGYGRAEYWLDDLPYASDFDSWEALVETLVDSTGRSGPSTWIMGSYPPGESGHPVTGISWFEARAYARWAGKSLPSAFHWYRAAGLGTPQHANFTGILARSNFESRGTVPVASLDGLGPWGTYDMAGNVREWCTNPSDTLRQSLGGGWQDSAYQFSDINAFDPLERAPSQGFRLILPLTEIDPDLHRNLVIPERVQSDPVDDAIFALYARLFDFDPIPLDARIDRIDDSHRLWVREHVSFNAPYGRERIHAHLFLPRNAPPPYQTVVHFPGGDAMLLGDINDAGLMSIEPFLRSGRAVIYPVYQGTFDRRPDHRPGPIGFRNLLVQQVKDVRRTVDYLESRDDIDSDRLLYHGLSLGAVRGSFALAIEQRFRTGILVSGGMVSTSHLPPEVQQIDYVTRIHMPLLMVNGKEDFNFPYRDSQRPFFESIATPEDEKHLLALDWGHLPTGYTDVIRAVVDWADRWLGPVNH
ncbi:MAG: SUMF1/EgtB/PvdO family nonheme iron enzyme [Wenzhouxiangella sp.]|nr:SUMF1/EgtB/PvdO family nonheme iron enzyme [Wenzhouxiangella sp.]